METFLKQIKFVEQREKDLVGGFVHESQLLFPDDNHYFVIPSLVIYTILYYFYDPERFDECHEGIKLNERGTIATHTLPDGDYKSVYGTRLISPDSKHTYEWKFRLVIYYLFHHVNMTKWDIVYMMKYIIDK